MSRRRLVTVLLVLGVVALFAVPLALDRGRSDYSGTDSQVTAVVEQGDPDYRPWFSSVFTPSSSEVESGLFALQAALGGGVLGYVLGRLRGRRLAERARADGDRAGPAREDGAT
ncbi:energy-coupling factor ABC transporter substrate-binding protein [Geodermatophilus sp. TF02-6]|uniref:energy-coupling factor ABC transporter substrate-binding protein n=1 Tax=Geodermatophilus sp. TF02-6 TaxID=2250575 RepID=UPI000DE952A8|nr:energy-coupling factor ABC transporter substrate-binding protein [Geodermatophilus sp. TF02-6]RBY78339.1 energy-coupling factor ABC transporter substrate-binding protein [Geodermatophilus sp. TF02-6]